MEDKKRVNLNFNIYENSVQFYRKKYSSDNPYEPMVSINKKDNGEYKNCYSKIVLEGEVVENVYNTDIYDALIKLDSLWHQRTHELSDHRLSIPLFTKGNEIKTNLFRKSKLKFCTDIELQINITKTTEQDLDKTRIFIHYKYKNITSETVINLETHSDSSILKSLYDFSRKNCKDKLNFVIIDNYI